MQIKFHVHFSLAFIFDEWLRAILLSFQVKVNATGISFGAMDYDFQNTEVRGYVTSLRGPSGDYFQLSIEDCTDGKGAAYSRICDALITSAWRQNFGKYEVLP
jgi:hypothetical protein